MFSRFQMTKAATLAAALAATILLAPSFASAQERPLTIYGEPAASRTEKVSFARLNLAAERDQKRLKRLVGAAVERVCLRDISHPGLQDRHYYACAREAWNGASPQIAAAISRASDLASSNGRLNDGAPIAVSTIQISVR